MNKYIKLLVESFFDDLEDDLDSEDIVSTQLGKLALKELKLVLCTTEDDVIAYFYDQFDQFVKSIPTQNKLESMFEYKSDLMIQNKKINCVIAALKYAANGLDIRLSMLGKSKYYTIDNRSQLNIEEMIKHLIPIDKIIENNKHTAVKYKISSKDIERMLKVIATQKWNGFTAITKIDKLIPRYAAYLQLRYATRLYVYDDERLFEYVIGAFPAFNKNSLLQKVYLKDLLATIE